MVVFFYTFLLPKNFLRYVSKLEIYIFLLLFLPLRLVCAL